MKNPNGPYPGRQLFLGMTVEKIPAFAYLVTGRSPASRERRATPQENSIINGPISNQPYHWLFHYTAVKYDNEIGLAVVSNGIQTDAIFEMYKLLYHAGSTPNKSYLKKIMDGANFEPDSLETPRIAGVITNPAGKKEPVFNISIVTGDRPAAAWRVKPAPGTFAIISTYQGNIESPAAFDVDGGLAGLKFTATSPQEIANFVYEISAMTYKSDDIRVFAVGGVRTDNIWKVALINRHKV